MIRRFGNTPVAGERYKIRHGAYAILVRDRRILLTHQQSPDPEYQLPGGGIDPGESPLQALHREVMEETGWTINEARKLGTFRRFVYMPEYDLMAEKICHIYLARPCLRKSEPTEAGHRAVWSSLARAISCVANPGDAWFLKSLTD